MTRISIRGARADKGLNQKDVAEQLGVSIPTYGLIERHPERITWGQAMQLAEIFGRDVEELAFYTPATESPEEGEVEVAS